MQGKLWKQLQQSQRIQEYRSWRRLRKSQTILRTIPQTVPQTIPQTVPRTIPQIVPRTIPQTVAAPLIPPNCLLTGISSKRPTQPGLVRSPSLTAKSTRSRTPAFMSFPEPLPMRRSVSKRGKRTRFSLSSMVSKSPTTAYPVSMSKKRTRYSSLQQTRKTPSL